MDVHCKVSKCVQEHLRRRRATINYLLQHVHTQVDIDQPTLLLD